MPVKISSIELFQCRIKLKEPFVISLGSLTHAENLLLIIRTDDGISGFGECSPFKTIHGESMQSAFEHAQFLASGMIGKNPLDIAAISFYMDTVLYGNTSVKSAFDIACHDIAAQHANLPLFQFLGGKNPKELWTDYTVSYKQPEKMAEDALKIKQQGFQFIKVKLGGTLDQDMERMRMIRETIGDDIPLRIDANQGWDKETAIQLLLNLRNANIQFCEEPVSRRSFLDLNEIQEKSPVPVMADESCFDEIDAKTLIHLKACDAFNIKLGKSSGIYKAKKIIRLAEENGIEMMAGGFLESRLGFSAIAHLAITSDWIKYIDFDTPLMFEEDPVTGGIAYSAGGKITVPETPGIGASIDPDFLKRMKSCTIKN